MINANRDGLLFLREHRYLLMSLYMLSLIIIGLLWPRETPFLEQYKKILTSSGILTSDFFEIGGISATLVNSGLIGLMAVSLLYFSKTIISGPTIAAIFTIAGFAMFGKTPLNIWPIPLGVAISAWIRKEHFNSFILMALFGTALGPVVSHISFGIGLGYHWGVATGILCGIILPGLATQLLNNHQGFCLSNTGFTCGIMGIFVAAFLKRHGFDYSPVINWHQGSQMELTIVFFLYFFSMMVLGIKGYTSMPSIMKQPGNLVTDYVFREGMDAAIFNMGLVGLIGMLYVKLVGGVFNGATLGGIFTMVGFAGFGKHPKNIWPIMLGVYIASIGIDESPASPVVLTAALFGTTLAPIAGGFGAITGVLAGFLHLSIVSYVGEFHYGMNLYNNGFAGGLIATLFVNTIRWLHLHRRSE